MFSERERWALKWHLMNAAYPNPDARHAFYAAWDALGLDAIAVPPVANPDALGAEESHAAELPPVVLLFLREAMRQPMNGATALILRAVDQKIANVVTEVQD